MQALTSLYVRIILETLLQLFNNFLRHTSLNEVKRESLPNRYSAL